MKIKINFFDVICILAFITAIIFRPSRLQLMMWIFIAFLQNKIIDNK